MIKNRIERSREFTPEEAQELIEAVSMNTVECEMKMSNFESSVREICENVVHDLVNDAILN